MDSEATSTKHDLRDKFVDLSALQDFLLSGKAKESLYCDFKGGIPDASAEVAKKDKKRESPQYSFCKAIAAFANSKGGFLIVGVDDDTLELKGCTSFKDPENRIDDLKKQIIPKPEAKIIKCLPLLSSEKVAYVVEVLPTPSFKKPHFFRGKIFFRVSDASRCEFVNSPGQLSDEIKSDYLHCGSIKGFKCFIEEFKSELTKLKFPYLDYYVAVGEYLERRRREEPDVSNVRKAIEDYESINQILSRYKQQPSSLSSDTTTEIQQVAPADVIDAIEKFSTSFILLLEKEVLHG